MAATVTPLGDAAAQAEVARIALETRALAIGYDGHTVADALSLRLPAGDLVCLLGPNGAGKSTLLRTLAGMQPALRGEVLLDGDALSALSARERARRLAVMLTDRVTTGLMTADELVALGRQPYTGWSGALTDADRQIVAQALASTGAEAFAGRIVADLSDGERQRVLLARALAQQPRLLILDEITAFLDLPRRVQTLQILRRLAHRERLAVLLSCHDLELALRSADRLWLMDGHGGLVTGAPEDLVLDGTLARVFASDGLHFDAEHGQFVIAQGGEHAVAIVDDDPQRHWLRRAAERAGYHIDAGAPLRIKSLGEGYALSDAEGVHHHASIESLVTSLRLRW